MWPQYLLVVVVLARCSVNLAQEANQPSVTPPRPPVTSNYGLDVSFPIHHALQKGTFQDKRYTEYMAGCYKRYNKGQCDSNERARRDLNKKQPKTQMNHTEVGFLKTRVPDETWKVIQAFWDRHKDDEAEEQWPVGNTYTNHWVNPTYMVSLEDRRFKEGRNIKNKIWDGIKPIMEEWVGHRVKPTSLYGIRVYKENAILASHVDRLPLVSSAIINVAQDIDEPWPVEVYSHDNVAHNVTMQPGEIVLYESHTCVHGRPNPLKGRSYANIFVHYMPMDEFGRDLNSGNSEQLRFPAKDDPPKIRGKANDGPMVGGHEHEQHGDHDMSEDDDDEKREEDGEQGMWEETMFKTGSTPLHMAAALGDMSKVSKIIAEGEEVSVGDMNNWHPIHEAARSGHLDVVQELVNHGADVGAVTTEGGTPLWWARQVHGDSHPVVSFLTSIGAPDMAADEL